VLSHSARRSRKGRHSELGVGGKHAAVGRRRRQGACFLHCAASTTWAANPDALESTVEASSCTGWRREFFLLKRRCCGTGLLTLMLRCCGPVGQQQQVSSAAVPQWDYQWSP
jgi:hypothetical protein